MSLAQESQEAWGPSRSRPKGTEAAGALRPPPGVAGFLGQCQICKQESIQTSRRRILGGHILFPAAEHVSLLRRISVFEKPWAALAPLVSPLQTSKSRPPGASALWQRGRGGRRITGGRRPSSGKNPQRTLLGEGLQPSFSPGGVKGTVTVPNGPLQPLSCGPPGMWPHRFLLAGLRDCSASGRARRG